METPTLTTIHGDLMDPDLKSELPRDVDVVVTSPPYKRKDGFSRDLLVRLGEALGWSMKPGARAFINFGQLREDFGAPFYVPGVVGCNGRLKVGQTVIWVKSLALNGVHRGHYQPLSGNALLNYCWEFIFQLYQEPEPMIDRLALGVPFADKSNMERGTRGQHGDLHCAGDVWFVPYETTGKRVKKKHPHAFPEALVERCLRLVAVPPGGVVMEPFCGSGTTAVVAKRLGLSCVLVDRVKENLIVARERWEEA